MSKLHFGRRISASANDRLPSESGYRRVNRLFPQVVAYRCAGAGLSVSLVLIYLPHMPTGSLLGLTIIVVQLALFAWFVISSWNALIVDAAFTKAALANTGWVAPAIGFTLLWAVFALVAMIVLAEPQIEEAAGLSAVMFITTFCVVTWRAQKVSRLKGMA